MLALPSNFSSLTSPPPSNTDAASLYNLKYKRVKLICRSIASTQLFWSVAASASFPFLIRTWTHKHTQTANGLILHAALLPRRALPALAEGAPHDGNS